MRKMMMISAMAATALSLAGCQSKEADNIEEASEANAQVYEDMADNATNETQEDALENKADAITAKGEEDANNKDDNGEIAPSEVGNVTR